MTSKTLRLIFPQWQGGNNPPYYLGSQLLSFLSLKQKGPLRSFLLSYQQQSHCRD